MSCAQELLPLRQNIDSRIYITLMKCATYRANPLSHSQILYRRMLMTTTTANLTTGIVSRNFNKIPSSPQGLIRQLFDESRPSSVCNSFRKVPILQHILHSKVFHRNDLILVNQFPTKLVLECVALISDFLMDFRHFCLLFLPRRRALHFPGQLTLFPDKFFLAFFKNFGLS